MIIQSCFFSLASNPRSVYGIKPTQTESFMLNNAKSCPFCGSTRLSFDCSHIGTSMRIRCRSCDALGPWVFKSHRETEADLAEECIERWNNRQSSDGFTKVQNTYYGGKSEDEIRTYGREPWTGESQIRTYRPTIPATHNRGRPLTRGETYRDK